MRTALPITAFLLGLLSVPLPALAQDDLDEGNTESAADGKKKARDTDGERVREVVRGYYLKAAIGSAALSPFQQVPMSGVMDLGLSLGSDFIDRERLSAAWELQFGQSLFNGPPSELLSVPVVEGDVHIFRGVALVEVSGYLSRRAGIGVRGGGGVMDLPLLITEEANADITGALGAPLAMHTGPLPLAVLGTTFEYYTKLSHFSLGADVDGQLVIPLAIGATFNGYLKYTF